MVVMYKTLYIVRTTPSFRVKNRRREPNNDCRGAASNGLQQRCVYEILYFPHSVCAIIIYNMKFYRRRPL